MLASRVCQSAATSAVACGNVLASRYQQYSTSQHQEAKVATGGAPGSQTTDKPQITPDRESTKAAGGRSSEVNAVRTADDPALKDLVHRVFSIYECKHIEQQRNILKECYDPAATYENNISMMQGLDDLLKRFSLLPITCKAVKVEYQPPVMLGATTSAPSVLDHLGDKGDLQVRWSTRHFELLLSNMS